MKHKLQTKTKVNYPKHPEQKDGEIFICNAHDRIWNSIGWKTKRRGKKAYELMAFLNEGKLIPVNGLFPVFIQEQEKIDYNSKKFLKEEK